MASNQAAWLKSKQANPLTVDSAPMPQPGPEEVVVKSSAIAINPVDWKIQDYGFFIEQFPNILGCDAAGEIEAVGSNVMNFKPGDRVLAHCSGLMTAKPENGGFQKYVATLAKMVSHLPSQISFTEGTVLPLAISTASAGLYQEDTLGLPFPSLSPKSANKVIVIWGASSSVGTTAVQLARASGVDTIATASSHNHDYVKGLGASQVVDYKSSSVVEDVLAAVKSSGKEFAGLFDCISLEDSLKASVEIVQKAGGAQKIATVLPGTEDKIPKPIQSKAVFAFTIAQNGVAENVWGKYVHDALKSGSLKPLPPPQVIGNGLEKVQDGMNANKKGLSAKKAVIEL